MGPTFPPPGFVPTESTIEGIQVYKPAPLDEDHRPVVAFECPQCGAATAYSIPAGGLTCTHCGYHAPAAGKISGKAAQEFEFTRETLNQADQGWGEARQELACQACGAHTSTPAEDLTHTCPFCGSNQVIQRQAPEDILRPRFLTPYRVTPESCRVTASEWLKSSWMTPRELRRLARAWDFTAVYLPYWTFDAVTSTSWQAEVGHTRSERYFDHADKTWKTRTRTVWRRESGRVRLPFDDLLVAGTGRVSARSLDRLQPFDLKALVPYEASYLAGLQAKAYDIPLESAWETARTEMRGAARLACREQASSGQIRNLSMRLDFSEETWRYILLPVYVAAYPYQGATYQVMVNGQTGAIAGQRPVDWPRVWLAVAALLAPGLLLGGFGLLTLLAGGIGVVFGALGLILLAVGGLISALIVRRAMGMDDR